MRLQSPRFAGLALVAAICVGALKAEAHNPPQNGQQEQHPEEHDNAVNQHHHHYQPQAKKLAEDDSHHAPAAEAGEETAAWNHCKPKNFCTPLILVCDHFVLEKILCPADILPPIIMDDMTVEAESYPEFSGQNNGKKPHCKVIGEPRYVTMPGLCYPKPPPICPIITNDTPPSADVNDEDGEDEDDEMDWEDEDEDVYAETADTVGYLEESARLHKRHGALRRRHNQGDKHDHHCRKPHNAGEIPHYGGNNDTWAGLCVQTGFFCADHLFACGLDPKVLYSCDKFGYPPNINVTCDNACVHGGTPGQDRCDNDSLADSFSVRLHPLPQQ